MSKPKWCMEFFEIDTGISIYMFHCDLKEGHDGRHQHTLEFCSHSEDNPHDLFDWGVDKAVPCPEWAGRMRGA